ncbi:hypothetical protein ACFLQ8_01550, partial [Candidatus Auribacterota bacterium]
GVDLSPGTKLWQLLHRYMRQTIFGGRVVFLEEPGKYPAYKADESGEMLAEVGEVLDSRDVKFDFDAQYEQLENRLEMFVELLKLAEVRRRFDFERGGGSHPRTKRIKIPLALFFGGIDFPSSRWVTDFKIGDFKTVMLKLARMIGETVKNIYNNTTEDQVAHARYNMAVSNYEYQKAYSDNLEKEYELLRTRMVPPGEEAPDLAVRAEDKLRAKIDHLFSLVELDEAYHDLYTQGIDEVERDRRLDLVDETNRADEMALQMVKERRLFEAKTLERQAEAFANALAVEYGTNRPEDAQVIKRIIYTAIMKANLRAFKFPKKFKVGEQTIEFTSLYDALQKCISPDGELAQLEPLKGEGTEAYRHMMDSLDVSIKRIAILESQRKKEILAKEQVLFAEPIFGVSAGPGAGVSMGVMFYLDVAKQHEITDILVPQADLGIEQQRIGIEGMRLDSSMEFYRLREDLNAKKKEYEALKAMYAQRELLLKKVQERDEGIAITEAMKDIRKAVQFRDDMDADMKRAKAEEFNAEALLKAYTYATGFIIDKKTGERKDLDRDVTPEEFLRIFEDIKNSVEVHPETRIAELEIEKGRIEERERKEERGMADAVVLSIGTGGISATVIKKLDFREEKIRILIGSMMKKIGELKKDEKKDGIVRYLRRIQERLRSSTNEVRRKLILRNRALKSVAGSRREGIEGVIDRYMQGEASFGDIKALGEDYVEAETGYQEALGRYRSLLAQLNEYAKFFGFGGVEAAYEGEEGISVEQAEAGKGQLSLITKIAERDDFEARLYARRSELAGLERKLYELARERNEKKDSSIVEAEDFDEKIKRLAAQKKQIQNDIEDMLTRARGEIPAVRPVPAEVPPVGYRGAFRNILKSPAVEKLVQHQKMETYVREMFPGSTEAAEFTKLIKRIADTYDVELGIHKILSEDDFAIMFLKYFKTHPELKPGERLPYLRSLLYFAGKTQPFIKGLLRKGEDLPFWLASHFDPFVRVDAKERFDERYVGDEDLSISKIGLAGFASRMTELFFREGRNYGIARKSRETDSKYRARIRGFVYDRYVKPYMDYLELQIKASRGIELTADELKKMAKVEKDVLGNMHRAEFDLDREEHLRVKPGAYEFARSLYNRLFGVVLEKYDNLQHDGIVNSFYVFMRLNGFDREPGRLDALKEFLAGISPVSRTFYGYHAMSLDEYLNLPNASTLKLLIKDLEKKTGRSLNDIKKEIKPFVDDINNYLFPDYGTVFERAPPAWSDSAKRAFALAVEEIKGLKITKDFGDLFNLGTWAVERYTRTMPVELPEASKDAKGKIKYPYFMHLGDHIFGVSKKGKLCTLTDIDTGEELTYKEDGRSFAVDGIKLSVSENRPGELDITPDLSDKDTRDNIAAYLEGLSGTLKIIKPSAQKFLGNVYTNEYKRFLEELSEKFPDIRTVEDILEHVKKHEVDVREWIPPLFVGRDLKAVAGKIFEDRKNISAVTAFEVNLANPLFKDWIGFLRYFNEFAQKHLRGADNKIHPEWLDLLFDNIAKIQSRVDVVSVLNEFLRSEKEIPQVKFFDPTNSDHMGIMMNFALDLALNYEDSEPDEDGNVITALDKFEKYIRYMIAVSGMIKTIDTTNRLYRVKLRLFLNRKRKMVEKTYGTLSKEEKDELKKRWAKEFYIISRNGKISNEAIMNMRRNVPISREPGPAELGMLPGAGPLMRGFNAMGLVARFFPRVPISAIVSAMPTVVEKGYIRKAVFDLLMESNNLLTERNKKLAEKGEAQEANYIVGIDYDVALKADREIAGRRVKKAYRESGLEIDAEAKADIKALQGEVDAAFTDSYLRGKAYDLTNELVKITKGKITPADARKMVALALRAQRLLKEGKIKLRAEGLVLEQEEARARKEFRWKLNRKAVTAGIEIDDDLNKLFIKWREEYVKEFPEIYISSRVMNGALRLYESRGLLFRRYLDEKAEEYKILPMVSYETEVAGVKKTITVKKQESAPLEELVNYYAGKLPGIKVELTEKQKKEIQDLPPDKQEAKRKALLKVLRKVQRNKLESQFEDDLLEKYYNMYNSIVDLAEEEVVAVADRGLEYNASRLEFEREKTDEIINRLREDLALEGPAIQAEVESFVARLTAEDLYPSIYRDSIMSSLVTALLKDGFWDVTEVTEDQRLRDKISRKAQDIWRQLNASETANIAKQFRKLGLDPEKAIAEIFNNVVFAKDLHVRMADELGAGIPDMDPIIKIVSRIKKENPDNKAVVEACDRFEKELKDVDIGRLRKIGQRMRLVEKADKLKAETMRKPVLPWRVIKKNLERVKALPKSVLKAGDPKQESIKLIGEAVKQRKEYIAIVKLAAEIEDLRKKYDALAAKKAPAEALKKLADKIKAKEQALPDPLKQLRDKEQQIRNTVTKIISILENVITKTPEKARIQHSLAGIVRVLSDYVNYDERARQAVQEFKEGAKGLEDKKLLGLAEKADAAYYEYLADEDGEWPQLIDLYNGFDEMSDALEEELEERDGKLHDVLRQVDRITGMGVPISEDEYLEEELEERDGKLHDVLRQVDRITGMGVPISEDEYNDIKSGEIAFYLYHQRRELPDEDAVQIGQNQLFLKKEFTRDSLSEYIKDTLLLNSLYYAYFGEEEMPKRFLTLLKDMIRRDEDLKRIALEDEEKPLRESMRDKVRTIVELWGFFSGEQTRMVRELKKENPEGPAIPILSDEDILLRVIELLKGRPGESTGEYKDIIGLLMRNIKTVQQISAEKLARYLPFRLADFLQVDQRFQDIRGNFDVQFWRDFNIGNLGSEQELERLLLWGAASRLGKLPDESEVELYKRVWYRLGKDFKEEKQFKAMDEFLQRISVMTPEVRRILYGIVYDRKTQEAINKAETEKEKNAIREKVNAEVERIVKRIVKSLSMRIAYQMKKDDLRDHYELRKRAKIKDELKIRAEANKERLKRKLKNIRILKQARADDDTKYRQKIEEFKQDVKDAIEAAEMVYPGVKKKITPSIENYLVVQYINGSKILPVPGEKMPDDLIYLTVKLPDVFKDHYLKTLYGIEHPEKIDYDSLSAKDRGIINSCVIKYEIEGKPIEEIKADIEYIKLVRDAFGEFFKGYLEYDGRDDAVGQWEITRDAVEKLYDFYLLDADIDNYVRQMLKRGLSKDDIDGVMEDIDAVAGIIAEETGVSVVRSNLIKDLMFIVDNAENVGFVPPPTIDHPKDIMSAMGHLLKDKRVELVGLSESQVRLLDRYKPVFEKELKLNAGNYLSEENQEKIVNMVIRTEINGLAGGIKAEFLRVGVKFSGEQVNTITSRAVNSGLGLADVKQLVDDAQRIKDLIKRSNDRDVAVVSILIYLDQKRGFGKMFGFEELFPEYSEKGVRQDVEEAGLIEVHKYDVESKITGQYLDLRESLRNKLLSMFDKYGLEYDKNAFVDWDDRNNFVYTLIMKNAGVQDLERVETKIEKLREEKEGTGITDIVWAVDMQEKLGLAELLGLEDPAAGTAAALMSELKEIELALQRAESRELEVEIAGSMVTQQDVDAIKAAAEDAQSKVPAPVPQTQNEKKLADEFESSLEVLWDPAIGIPHNHMDLETGKLSGYTKPADVGLDWISTLRRIKELKKEIDPELKKLEDGKAKLIKAGKFKGSEIKTYHDEKKKLLAPVQRLKKHLRQTVHVMSGLDTFRGIFPESIQIIKDGREVKAIPEVRDRGVKPLDFAYYTDTKYSSIDAAFAVMALSMIRDHFADDPEMQDVVRDAADMVDRADFSMFVDAETGLLLHGLNVPVHVKETNFPLYGIEPYFSGGKIQRYDNLNSEARVIALFLIGEGKVPASVWDNMKYDTSNRVFANSYKNSAFTEFTGNVFFDEMLLAPDTLGLSHRGWVGAAVDKKLLYMGWAPATGLGSNGAYENKYGMDDPSVMSPYAALLMATAGIPEADKNLGRLLGLNKIEFEGRKIYFDSYDSRAGRPSASERVLAIDQNLAFLAAARNDVRALVADTTWAADAIKRIRERNKALIDMFGKPRIKAEEREKLDSEAAKAEAAASAAGTFLEVKSRQRKVNDLIEDKIDVEEEIAELAAEPEFAPGKPVEIIPSYWGQAADLVSRGAERFTALLAALFLNLYAFGGVLIAGAAGWIINFYRWRKGIDRKARKYISDVTGAAEDSVDEVLLEAVSEYIEKLERLPFMSSEQVDRTVRDIYITRAAVKPFPPDWDLFVDVIVRHPLKGVVARTFAVRLKERGDFIKERAGKIKDHLAVQGITDAGTRDNLVLVEALNGYLEQIEKDSPVTLKDATVIMRNTYSKIRGQRGPPVVEWDQFVRICLSEPLEALKGDLPKKNEFEKRLIEKKNDLFPRPFWMKKSNIIIIAYILAALIVLSFYGVPIIAWIQSAGFPLVPLGIREDRVPDDVLDEITRDLDEKPLLVTEGLAPAIERDLAFRLADWVKNNIVGIAASTGITMLTYRMMTGLQLYSAPLSFIIGYFFIGYTFYRFIQSLIQMSVSCVDYLQAAEGKEKEDKNKKFIEDKYFFVRQLILMVFTTVFAFAALHHATSTVAMVGVLSIFYWMLNQGIALLTTSALYDLFGKMPRLRIISVLTIMGTIVAYFGVSISSLAGIMAVIVIISFLKRVEIIREEKPFELPEYDVIGDMMTIPRRYRSGILVNNLGDTPQGSFVAIFQMLTTMLKNVKEDYAEKGKLDRENQMFIGYGSDQKKPEVKKWEIRHFLEVAKQYGTDRAIMWARNNLTAYAKAHLKKPGGYQTIMMYLLFGLVHAVEYVHKYHDSRPQLKRDRFGRVTEHDAAALPMDSDGYLMEDEDFEWFIQFGPAENMNYLSEYHTLTLPGRPGAEKQAFKDVKSVTRIYLEDFDNETNRLRAINGALFMSELDSKGRERWRLICNHDEWRIDDEGYIKYDKIEKPPKAPDRVRLRFDQRILIPPRRDGEAARTLVLDERGYLWENGQAVCTIRDKDFGYGIKYRLAKKVGDEFESTTAGADNDVFTVKAYEVDTYKGVLIESAKDDGSESVALKTGYLVDKERNLVKLGKIVLEDKYSIDEKKDRIDVIAQQYVLEVPFELKETVIYPEITKMEGLLGIELKGDAAAIRKTVQKRIAKLDEERLKLILSEYGVDIKYYGGKKRKALAQMAKETARKAVVRWDIYSGLDGKLIAEGVYKAGEEDLDAVGRDKANKDGGIFKDSQGVVSYLEKGREPKIYGREAAGKIPAKGKFLAYTDEKGQNVLIEGPDGTPVRGWISGLDGRRLMTDMYFKIDRGNFKDLVAENEMMLREANMMADRGIVNDEHSLNATKTGWEETYYVEDPLFKYKTKVFGGFEVNGGDGFIEAVEDIDGKIKKGDLYHHDGRAKVNTLIAKAGEFQEAQRVKDKKLGDVLEVIEYEKGVEINRAYLRGSKYRDLVRPSHNISDKHYYVENRWFGRTISAENGKGFMANWADGFYRDQETGKFMYQDLRMRYEDSLYGNTSRLIYHDTAKDALYEREIIAKAGICTEPVYAYDTAAGIDELVGFMERPVIGHYDPDRNIYRIEKGRMKGVYNKLPSGLTVDGNNNVRSDPQPGDRPNIDVYQHYLRDGWTIETLENGDLAIVRKLADKGHFSVREKEVAVEIDMAEKLELTDELKDFLRVNTRYGYNEKTGCLVLKSGVMTEAERDELIGELPAEKKKQEAFFRKKAAIEAFYGRSARRDETRRKRFGLYERNRARTYFGKDKVLYEKEAIAKKGTYAPIYAYDTATKRDEFVSFVERPTVGKYDRENDMFRIEMGEMKGNYKKLPEGFTVDGKYNIRGEPPHLDRPDLETFRRYRSDGWTVEMSENGDVVARRKLADEGHYNLIEAAAVDIDMAEKLDMNENLRRFVEENDKYDYEEETGCLVLVSGVMTEDEMNELIKIFPEKEAELEAFSRRSAQRNELRDRFFDRYDNNTTGPVEITTLDSVTGSLHNTVYYDFKEDALYERELIAKDHTYEFVTAYDTGLKEDVIVGYQYRAYAGYYDKSKNKFYLRDTNEYVDRLPQGLFRDEDNNVRKAPAPVDEPHYKIFRDYIKDGWEITEVNGDLVARRKIADKGEFEVNPDKRTIHVDFGVALPTTSQLANFVIESKEDLPYKTELIAKQHTYGLVTAYDTGLKKDVLVGYQERPKAGYYEGKRNQFYLSDTDEYVDILPAGFVRDEDNNVRKAPAPADEPHYRVLMDYEKKGWEITVLNGDLVARRRIVGDSKYEYDSGRLIIKQGKVTEAERDELIKMFPAERAAIVEFYEKNELQNRLFGTYLKYRDTRDFVVSETVDKMDKGGNVIETVEYLAWPDFPVAIINQTDADSHLGRSSIVKINSPLIRSYEEKLGYSMVQPAVSYQNPETGFARSQFDAQNMLLFNTMIMFRKFKEASAWGKMTMFVPLYVLNVVLKEAVPFDARCHDHWEALKQLTAIVFGVREDNIIRRKCSDEEVAQIMRSGRLAPITEDSPASFYAFELRGASWLGGDIKLLMVESKWGVAVVGAEYGVGVISKIGKLRSFVYGLLGTGVVGAIYSLFGGGLAGIAALFIPFVAMRAGKSWGYFAEQAKKKGWANWRLWVGSSLIAVFLRPFMTDRMMKEMEKEHRLPRLHDFVLGMIQMGMFSAPLFLIWGTTIGIFSTLFAGWSVALSIAAGMTLYGMAMFLMIVYAKFWTPLTERIFEENRQMLRRLETMKDSKQPHKRIWAKYAHLLVRNIPEEWRNSVVFAADAAVGGIFVVAVYIFGFQLMPVFSMFPLLAALIKDMPDDRPLLESLRDLEWWRNIPRIMRKEWLRTAVALTGASYYLLPLILPSGFVTWVLGTYDVIIANLMSVSPAKLFMVWPAGLFFKFVLPVILGFWTMTGFSHIGEVTRQYWNRVWDETAKSTSQLMNFLVIMFRPLVMNWTTVITRKAVAWLTAEEVENMMDLGRITLWRAYGFSNKWFFAIAMLALGTGLGLGLSQLLSPVFEKLITDVWMALAITVFSGSLIADMVKSREAWWKWLIFSVGTVALTIPFWMAALPAFVPQLSMAIVYTQLIAWFGIMPFTLGMLFASEEEHRKFMAPFIIGSFICLGALGGVLNASFFFAGWPIYLVSFIIGPAISVWQGIYGGVADVLPLVVFAGVRLKLLSWVLEYRYQLPTEREVIKKINQLSSLGYAHLAMDDRNRAREFLDYLTLFNMEMSGDLRELYKAKVATDNDFVDCRGKMWIQMPVGTREEIIEAINAEVTADRTMDAGKKQSLLDAVAVEKLNLAVQNEVSARQGEFENRLLEHDWMDMSELTRADIIIEIWGKKPGLHSIMERALKLPLREVVGSSKLITLTTPVKNVSFLDGMEDYIKLLEILSKVVKRIGPRDVVPELKAMLPVERWEGLGPWKYMTAEDKEGFIRDVIASSDARAGDEILDVIKELLEIKPEQVVWSEKYEEVRRELDEQDEELTGEDRIKFVQEVVGDLGKDRLKPALELYLELARANKDNKFTEILMAAGIDPQDVLVYESISREAGRDHLATQVAIKMDLNDMEERIFDLAKTEFAKPYNKVYRTAEGIVEVEEEAEILAEPEEEPAAELSRARRAYNWIRSFLGRNKTTMLFLFFMLFPAASALYGAGAVAVQGLAAAGAVSAVYYPAAAAGLAALTGIAVRMRAIAPDVPVIEAKPAVVPAVQRQRTYREIVDKLIVYLSEKDIYEQVFEGLYNIPVDGAKEIKLSEEFIRSVPADAVLADLITSGKLTGEIEEGLGLTAVQSAAIGSLREKIMTASKSRDISWLTKNEFIDGEPAFIREGLERMDALTVLKAIISSGIIDYETQPVDINVYDDAVLFTKISGIVDKLVTDRAVAQALKDVLIGGKESEDEKISAKMKAALGVIAGNIKYFDAEAFKNIL